MAARYFLVDLNRLPRDKALGRKTFPAGTVGGRFNSLPHARRELAAAVGPWMLIDRETGTEVAPADSPDKPASGDRHTLPADAATTDDYPTRCGSCNRPVHRWAVFPGDRCLPCHAAVTPMPTADDVIRAWGG